MDLLNWIILFFVVLTLFNLRTRRSAQVAQVPPYEEVEEETLSRPQGDGWETSRMESMPREHRRRIVLTVVVDGLRSIEWTQHLLWQLAGSVQSRLQAHVIVVEAFAKGEAQRAGEGLGRLLLAVDGGGWSGEEHLLAAWAGRGVAEQSFDLGEVHQKLFDGQSPLG